MPTLNSAIVFAYHNVGVQCLSVLLKHGIDVRLVVTHRDNPEENIWFDSVAALAQAHSIPVITPDDPNTAEIVQQLRQADFLFSFYYRHMLSPEVLALPKRGAYNMHGSLLPKYRGRVPINWAIIKGETETGATLHEMVEKPDAGRIVDQMAVTILPNDLAIDVFNKVVVAAAVLLDRSLPALIAGTAGLRTQELSQGSYFGGRKPEDGIINWDDSAQNIHNLIRAVAPPYPGAMTSVAGKQVVIARSQLEPGRCVPGKQGFLEVDSQHCMAGCGDGGRLRILEVIINDKLYAGAELGEQLGIGVHALGK